ncbi:MAG TPA: SPW repeat protein [Thermoleophilaceae bacterium]|nr:SPW repeat protein [Thermoleophilaceae bacterium]
MKEPRERPTPGRPDLADPTRSTVDPVDPIAPAAHDWRSEVVGASGLNVLIGAWLIIAPWVLPTVAGDPKWNDVVFGFIVGAFGLTRMFGAYRESWISWINALIGVWIFIAAFTIDVSTVAFWNDIACGIAVFVLAVWSASASDAARHMPRRRQERYRGGRVITH